MERDPRTVLVVEDHRVHLDLLTTWLDGEYRLRTATDGATALERFDSTVDVVLLDRRMPDTSGDEVLGRLRARPGYCRVVMVTAVVPDEDAVSLPFDDYLVKPLSREAVEDAVETAHRHANYGRIQDELYTVASRLGVLETYIPEAQLDRNPDYRALEERFSELQVEFDAVIDGVDDWECWHELEGGVHADDRPPTNPRRSNATGSSSSEFEPSLMDGSTGDSRSGNAGISGTPAVRPCSGS